MTFASWSHARAPKTPADLVEQLRSESGRPDDASMARATTVINTAARWRWELKVGRRIWELVWGTETRLRLLRFLVEEYRTKAGQDARAEGREDELKRFETALDDFLTALRRFRGGAGVPAPVPLSDSVPDDVVVVQWLRGQFKLGVGIAARVVGRSEGYLAGVRRDEKHREAELGGVCRSCGRMDDHSQRLNTWRRRGAGRARRLECPDCVHVWRPLE